LDLAGGKRDSLSNVNLGVYPQCISGRPMSIGMPGKMDRLLRYPKSFPEVTGRGICRDKMNLIPAK
jgi:hypothetical protein